MKRAITSLLLCLLIGGSAFGEEELPRIGFLGVRISAPGKPGEGATIRRVIEGSEAQRIGLTTSDKIVSLNARPIDTDMDVENFFDRQPANARVNLEILRDGKRMKLEATLPPLPRENFAGVEYHYDFVRNSKGERLRTIVTRPAHAAAKLPAIFIVGWLSCDSCEYPFGPGSGMDQLLAYLVKDSGFAVVRMDKPGVGDSEGVCAEADFKSEISGFEAAFKSIEKYPFIERERIAVVGMSNGGGFAPIAAPPSQVKGYVAIGSWGRTWYEHMLAIERESRIAMGVAPSKINSDLKMVTDFYRLYLIEKQTPKEILAAHPDWKGIWNDGDATQYGRPAAFYQQLQDLNLGEVWAAVKMPVLVLRGEYDWIMPRADGHAIVDSVNASAPLAKYIELPRTTHGLSQFDSLVATQRGGHGEYYEPVEATVTQFLKGVLK
jgi:pimeloyl-ACP methyl ester carboxylesterase